MTEPRVTLGIVIRDLVRFRNVQTFIPARTEDLDIMGILLPIVPAIRIGLNNLLNGNDPTYCVVNLAKAEVVDYFFSWKHALLKAEELNRSFSA
jgi:hypothetical protein